MNQGNQVNQGNQGEAETRRSINSPPIQKSAAELPGGGGGGVVRPSSKA